MQTSFLNVKASGIHGYLCGLKQLRLRDATAGGGNSRNIAK
jgi:hypothetical protein